MGKVFGRKALLAVIFLFGLAAGSMGLPTASHAIAPVNAPLVVEAFKLTKTLRAWRQQYFSYDSLPLGYCETRKRARAVIGLLEAASYANPGDLGLIAAASALADAEAWEHDEWEYYCPECDDYYNDDPCDCHILLPRVHSVYNWSGFYIGVNGGGASGRTIWDEPGSTTGRFGVSGELFGGTIGYNYQWNRAVVGVEATIDATNINGTALQNCLNCTTSNTYLGTVDARFGYAAGNILPYIKGGVAFGNIQQKVPGFPGTDSGRTGWDAAIGVEWGFKRSWSVKAEYNHIDLGSTTCSPLTCGGTATTPLTIDTFTVGVNKHF
jgi:outer membrane immunogenic protein